MIKKLVVISALFLSAVCVYGQVVDTPFSKALIDGEAIVPLNGPEYSKVVTALQKSTKNDGEIILHFKRLTRFKEQPTCGRLTFYAEQPSTKSIWKNLGGDLNYCEDGLPPLKICPEAPKKLINPDATCKGGTRPIDTPEVALAMKKSLDGGSLTATQVQEKLAADKDTKGSIHAK